MGSLDSGERVRLIDDCCANVQYAKPGYLLFLRGQTLMAQAFDARALTLTGSPSRIAEGLRYTATPTTRFLRRFRYRHARVRLGWQYRR